MGTRLSAGCLLALACATARPAPRTDALAVERRLLADARAAGDRQDFALAWREFAAAIGDATFGQLTSAERHQAFRNASYAAWALKDGEMARSFALRALALPEAEVTDVALRMAADHLLGDQRDCVQAVIDVAGVSPRALEVLGMRWVLEADRCASQVPRAEKLRLRFLRVLFDADYRFDAGESPHWLWSDLAGLEIEEGDVARATRVALAVRSPRLLVGLRADKRFAAIVAAHPDRFDVSRAASEWVETSRELAQRRPDKLEAVANLVEALGARGGFAEALAIADEAIGRATGDARPPFDDVRRWLPWLREGRARTLWSLGRFEDALDEWEEIAGDEADDVSHRINLAGREIELGRGKDALDDLGRLDRTHASPFGRMQLEAVRAVAADQAGDAAAREEALAWLRAHEADAPDAAFTAAVWLKDVEGAARVIKTALADPEHRAEALGWVQELRESAQPPLAKEWKETFRRVASRPDVRDAVARVGKSEHYDIF